MQGRYIVAGLLALTGFSLLTTASHAGFQYVPPTAAQAPAATGSDLTPGPAPATQVPVQPVQTQVLAPVPPAAVVPPPAPALPLPEDAQAQPQAPVPHLLKVKTITPEEATQPQPETAHILKLPKPAAPAPVSAAAKQAESDMKAPAQTPPLPLPTVATATPAPVVAVPVAVVPAANKIQWNPAPPAAPIVAAKPIEAPSAPGRSVIMPSDAPEAALSATPSSKKLVINPFPQQDTGAAAAVPAPVQAEAVTPAENANSNGSEFDKVVGFGSDMPLALALQQIAPPSYTFSFGASVNPGVRVSWDGGGKPWDQVISDMISPLGLSSEINGNVVHIGKTGVSDLETGEKHSDAVMPEDKPVKIAEADLRRENITDPGEQPRVQPLSKLVNMETSSGEQQATQQASIPQGVAEETIDAPKSESDAATVTAAVSPGAQDSVPSLLPPESAPPISTAAADVAAASTAGTWKAHQGDNLKDVLGAWSKQANVDLVWNATHDFTVDADVTVNDTFQTAVKTVVDQGVKTDSKPVFNLQAATDKSKGGILTVKDKT